MAPRTIASAADESGMYRRAIPMVLKMSMERTSESFAWFFMGMFLLYVLNGGSMLAKCLIERGFNGRLRDMYNRMRPARAGAACAPCKQARESADFTQVPARRGLAPRAQARAAGNTGKPTSRGGALHAAHWAAPVSRRATADRCKPSPAADD